jgi:hypothetical protein
MMPERQKCAEMSITTQPLARHVFAAMDRLAETKALLWN